MKKKVIKYTIFLLIFPLLLSLIIACTSNSRDFNSGKYDPNELPDVSIEKIDTSSYVYFGVFLLVISAAGVWLYVKKKEGF